MIGRHKDILELLVRDNTVSVEELSEQLKVSSVTIRNDLNQLADQGRLVRLRGGARLPAGRAGEELSFNVRKNINALNKRKIGETAATLIRPMESILLDASTTAIALAQAIRRRESLREITVIPTGIWTAIELLSCGIDVIIAGGHVRQTTGSITGLPAMEFLKNFNVQKAFLGAWGISPTSGLTDTPLVEVELKKIIVEHAQEVIALVDGSKFGQIGLASYASINQLSTVVTDASAPREIVEKIRNSGVEVIIAK
jgi:DeoR family transcriptional regulator of aga operon